MCVLLGESWGTEVAMELGCLMKTSKLFLHSQEITILHPPKSESVQVCSHYHTCIYPTELHFEQVLYFLGDVFGSSHLLLIYKQLL